MHHSYKSIVNNTLAQLVAKFVGAGLTLVTTIYIIRLAGPGLFGDLTKTLVLVAIGFTAIDFGINAEAVRHLGRGGDKTRTLADVVVTRLLLSALAVSILNGFVIMLGGGYTPAVKSVFFVGSIAIIFQGLYTSINAWFQFSEQYWKSAVATIVGSVIGSALTIWCIFFSPSLWGLVYANTAGYLVIAGVAIYLGKDAFSLTSNPRRIVSLLHRSLGIGAILLASVVAAKADTIILGVQRSATEVGQYGFVYRIFEVILVVPVFTMNAAYPLLVKLENAAAAKIVKATTTSLLVLGVLAALATYVGAPYLSLIRPGLGESITLLRLLAVSLPFFYVTAPLMWKLIGTRRDMSVLGAYMIAATFNIMANLLTIPHYGAYAAAVNTGLTELIILLGLLYCSHKS